MRHPGKTQPRTSEVSIEGFSNATRHVVLKSAISITHMGFLKRN
jgi:hypothetical protein